MAVVLLSLSEVLTILVIAVFAVGVFLLRRRGGGA
jgi:hypothetical protein